jgi:hypothetical protein
MLPPNKVLCILYSSGGTADVGRHAVRAALDMCPNQLRVLTADPATLEEKNWKCACDPPHEFTKEERDRMDIRKVDFSQEDFTRHLENCGAVISALGNREPFHGDRVGTKGTQLLVNAMERSQDVKRVVAVTSAGLNEDWPPMEFHWAGSILKWMFRTVSRRAIDDLAGAENALLESSLDCLIIRPVGLGEDRRPKKEWHIQKEKYKDKLGVDMSKLDCARFAVSEVLQPSYHKRAVVVGSDFETFQFDASKE